MFGLLKMTYYILIIDFLFNQFNFIAVSSWRVNCSSYQKCSKVQTTRQKQLKRGGFGLIPVYSVTVTLGGHGDRDWKWSFHSTVSTTCGRSAALMGLLLWNTAHYVFPHQLIQDNPSQACPRANAIQTVLIEIPSTGDSHYSKSIINTNSHKQFR